jgi:hypothetical protein
VATLVFLVNRESEDDSGGEQGNKYPDCDAKNPEQRARGYENRQSDDSNRSSHKLKSCTFIAIA